jgi:hypothetical protein
LLFSTYLGGSDREQSFGLALDRSGGVYVVGSTLSPDFPIRKAIQPSYGGGYADAFVLKMGDLISVPAAIITMWIGLKNSDDQGMQLDLRAEVYRNGALASAGETRCITGVTRNPTLTRQVAVDVGQLTGFGPGDQLSLKFLTRIGTNPDGTKCSGPGGSHSNAVGLRLYYDSTSQPAALAAALDSSTIRNHFLHSPGVNLFLDTTAPTASSAKYRDSPPVNFATGNVGREIDSWHMMVQ